MGSLGTGWAGFFLNPEPGHTEGGTPPLTPQFIFFSYGTSAYSTRMFVMIARIWYAYLLNFLPGIPPNSLFQKTIRGALMPETLPVSEM